MSMKKLSHNFELVLVEFTLCTVQREDPQRMCILNWTFLNARLGIEKDCLSAKCP